MPVSLHKQPSVFDVLLTPAERARVEARMPHVRMALKYPSDHPLGKVNGPRVELVGNGLVHYHGLTKDQVRRLYNGFPQPPLVVHPEG